jgi:hypothetical protein
MPTSCMSPQMLDDLFDLLMFERAAHLQRPTNEEAAVMKLQLFAVMTDGEGWGRDPDEMGRRLRFALDTLGVSKSH